MIEQLRQKLRDGQFEYSLHAVRQMIARRIANGEIIQAILAGESILTINTAQAAWYWELPRAAGCMFIARIRAARC